MKLVTRGTLLGRYESERVIVVALPDDSSEPDQLCEIEYPLSDFDQREPTRKRVRWGDVELQPSSNTEPADRRQGDASKVRGVVRGRVQLADIRLEVFARP